MVSCSFDCSGAFRGQILRRCSKSASDSSSRVHVNQLHPIRSSQLLQQSDLNRSRTRFGQTDGRVRIQVRFQHRQLGNCFQSVVCVDRGPNPVICNVAGLSSVFRSGLSTSEPIKKHRYGAAVSPQGAFICQQHTRVPRKLYFVFEWSHCAPTLRKQRTSFHLLLRSYSLQRLSFDSYSYPNDNVKVLKTD